MKTLRLSRIFALAALAGTVHAQTAIWTGDGDADNSGDWSAASNWSPSVPGSGATASLGDVSAGTRVVTYDASASGSLGALDLIQTTAGATNVFSIKRDLALDGDLVVGANGGDVEVSLGNAAAKTTLTVGSSGSGNITVNNGGKFALDFVTDSNTGSDLLAHVTVNNGGAFQVGSSASGTHASTSQATLARSLTLTSGSSLVLDTASRAAVRLAVQGNFTANGATLSTTSGSGGSIYFDGSSVSLTDTTIGTINFTVRGSGAKTFSSDTALNRLYLIGRNNAALEVSVTAPSTTGLYLTHESAGQSVGLKLTGDLALAANGVQLNATGGATSGTTTYIIDTNGHTLDLSLGQNYGKWTPNKGTETTAVWDLRGTGTGGIKARAFDFSTANVQTTLGAGFILEAISGSNASSRANNLSGTGTIDAASVFRFNPADASHAGTLQSNRDIGILEVKAGTLTIDGSTDFAAQGGIVVDAGATLNLDTRTVASPAYTFGLNGATIGRITGGSSAVSLAGTTLVFSFTGTATAGTYDAYATTYGITGSPDSVSIAGSYILELSRSGNIWSGTTGGYTFSFSSETGYLVVTQAIPEPSAVALLAGAAGLLAAGFWRGRRKG